MLLVLSVTLLGGCSDWLDYTPKDKQTDTQLFSTRDGFYEAINGVYNRLISSTMYGENLTYGMLEAMGQRYALNSLHGLYNFSKYTYTEKYAAKRLKSVWEEAYSTILNCNVILDNLEEQKGKVVNEKEYSIMKGDVLALRCFLHFDMMRLFGPIYSRAPKDARIPYNMSADAQSYEQLPAETFFKEFLIPDLTLAEELLAQHDPVLTDGPMASTIEGTENYLRYRQLRLNYYAVALLKARACLWIGDNETALAEARKITDDEKAKAFFPFVDPDRLLGNNVDPDRVFSTETVFGFYKKDFGDIYTYNFASSLSSTTVLRPRDGYLSLLFSQTEDYRYQSQWVNVTGGGELVKYKGFIDSDNDESNNPFHVTFFSLMKISEAYYIAAEALRNTDLEKACAYLTTIKKARGGQAFSSTTASNLLKEIELEYVRETYGEGQSFYLFKRLYLSIEEGLNGREDPWWDSPSTSRYVVPLPESELTNR